MAASAPAFRPVVKAGGHEPVRTAGPAVRCTGAGQRWVPRRPIPRSTTRMTFASTGLRGENGAWVLTGDLTIRAVTRPAEFEVEFQRQGTSRRERPRRRGTHQVEARPAGQRSEPTSWAA
jgi:hypothetical protein